MLPHVPPNLIDHWARLLKKNTDWSHDTRAIRAMLRQMAEEVAKEEEELRLDISPRKMPSHDRLDAEVTGLHDVAEVDVPEETAFMDYADDDFILSPLPSPPLPSGQRDDSRVYK